MSGLLPDYENQKPVNFCLIEKNKFPSSIKQSRLQLLGISLLSILKIH